MLAIYARISREKLEGKDRSINDQVQTGKELAEKLKLDYEVYIDEGYSGTLDIEDRPELMRLVEDILNKKITHVFAYDQSRLERNKDVWSKLYGIFQDKKVKLSFKDTPEFDFESDENFLFSHITSLINNFYAKVASSKIKSVLARNIQDGKVHAKSAFGYTKDENGYLIVDEEESKIVKRIYQMSLQGKGTDKIAEILNYEGIPTSYNKDVKGGSYKIRDRYDPTRITEKKKSDAKWRGKTVQGIIKNTLYKGDRFWKGNYYKAPAIFDEVYWQKVNENLQKNRNNTGKKVEHKYLLKGIIKCNCGRNMYGRSRVNKRDHTYICSSRRYKGENCGNRAINIDKIENLIWEHFFIKDELLKLLNEASNSGDSVLEKLLIEKELLEKRFQDNEKGRQNLMKFIAGGVITMDDAKTQLEQINNDSSKIRIEISDIEFRIANFKDFERLVIETKEDFKQYTLETDFEVKRNLVHKYIEKIVVAYKDTPEFPNSYYLLIGFKNEIVQEKYIFDAKSGYIYSLRDQVVKKLVGSEIQYIVSFEDIDKQILHVQDGRTLIKPHFYLGDSFEFITNTFIPYGEIRNWNLEKVISFYEMNSHWLSDDSGLNIYTLDKSSPVYKWFVENYSNYKDKGIKDWFTFLFEKHLNAINKRFSNE